MKNFKNGLLGLALVAGITGAFATQVAKAHKLTGPLYNWSDGNGDNLPTSDRDAAVAHYECDGDGPSCAVGQLAPGQTGDPQIEIFKD